MILKENEFYKSVESSNYNYIFDKKTGYFARWGSTKENDPLYAPAPEILDLEISSGGDCLGNCAFCYKANGGDQSTHNMSFEEFKIIFHKIPKNLTQIAFGIMNISTNPDFFKMMRYARDNGVIPNYTCHGLDVTEDIAKKTFEICGAVAVSFYNKEKTFDSIKMFTDSGMSQVNIHFMLAKETFKDAINILNEVKSDNRVKNLNAIVFLQLKQKGRGSSFHNIGVKEYKELIQHAKEKNVNIGFDSCSAPLYFKSVEDNESDYKNALMLAEPCESSIFSSYINCKGEFFPCSFSEGVGDWKEGLDVLHCNNFIDDIWNHEKTLAFRYILLNSCNMCDCKSKNICRSCPIYPEVTECKYE